MGILSHVIVDTIIQLSREDVPARFPIYYVCFVEVHKVYDRLRRYLYVKEQRSAEAPRSDLVGLPRQNVELEVFVFFLLDDNVVAVDKPLSW